MWLSGWVVGCQTCDQQVAGSNPSRPAVECKTGQVVYTRTSVTKQYNLIPANGRWCSAAGEVTTGLVESNGSLPPGLCLRSPAGWMLRTGISSGTRRSFRAPELYPATDLVISACRSFRGQVQTRPCTSPCEWHPHDRHRSWHSRRGSSLQAVDSHNYPMSQRKKQDSLVLSITWLNSDWLSNSVSHAFHRATGGHFKYPLWQKLVRTFKLSLNLFINKIFLTDYR